MCGRYQLTTSFSLLPQLLKIETPYKFKEHYQKRNEIRPNQPILVLKNEGKLKTTLMLWGLITPFCKSPDTKLKPINARFETIETKKIFRSSWKYKRCLIPASAYIEKKHLIKKESKDTFWLGGIWSTWTSLDGSEIESCCIITTEANEVIRSLHNRMPVIIPNGGEEEWLEPNKNNQSLKELKTTYSKSNTTEWIKERISNAKNHQLNLF